MNQPQLQKKIVETLATIPDGLTAIEIIVILFDQKLVNDAVAVTFALKCLVDNGLIEDDRYQATNKGREHYLKISATQS